MRGSTDQTLEQGEPLRIAVRVGASRGAKDAITLSPASGTWADAITVELLSASGTTVAARAEPVGKPDATAATLDAKHLAGGLWRFSPETMQTVAPGFYRLRVQLKIDSGGGWKGVAAAREIPLTVVAPTTKPSSAAIVNRAQDLLLMDKVQDAAALVDAGLKNAPRDYALLKVRALIAEKAGNPLAAILCLNAATFSTARKTTGQPPAEDNEMMARLRELRKTASANPPAWTWPPEEVLLALSENAKKSGFFPTMWAKPAAGARNEPAPVAPTLAPTLSASPTNPIKVTHRIPIETAVTPSTPAQASVASASVAVPAPPALPEPMPGVIVPAAELTDAKITADSTGQWAAGAAAGSQYGSPNYAAAKLTGPPDVPTPGDNFNAWCHGSTSNGEEWIELTYSTPVHAAEVRVRQTNCPGAITRVEAIEPDGTSHLWWAGKDSFKLTAQNTLAWFAVKVPKTSYLVAKIKITLNLATVPGWKEIDAVQLVGTAP